MPRLSHLARPLLGLTVLLPFVERTPGSQPQPAPAQESRLTKLPAPAQTAGFLAGARNDARVPQAPPLPSHRLHPALAGRLAEDGGTTKAWVFFTDKGIDSPQQYAAAIAQLGATYNQRAIQRRMLRGDAARGGALFTERDLPIVRSYMDAVVATGVQLHVTSRWLNAVSVRGTLAQCEQIAGLPCVRAIQPVARARRVDALDQRAVPRDPGDDDDPPRGLKYGLSGKQLTQINLPPVHEAGFTAKGVIVGILDTGFHRTHQAFTNPDHPLKIVAEYDFLNKDPNTDIEPGDHPDQHVHGTLILGCLGAYLPGDLIGGAPDASFILCKTEDVAAEYPAEEDNYVAGLEFIEAQGGDMATASLGYIDWYTQSDLDGQTAVTTIAVNIATSHGVHCCNAAGNESHDDDPKTSHLIAPADAFQVITCGAVTSAGGIAGFSSDGPTFDGRVKPELLARGVDTFTVSPYADDTFMTASGTSLSTPLVACAVACLVQAHPEWTVDELRKRFFYSARGALATGGYDPLYVRGFGIANAFAATQDCNGNGLPDLYDIHSGASPDCQHNDIPDECELAAGTSADCNENGVPDECDVAPPDPELRSDLPAVVGWKEIFGFTDELWLSGDGVTLLKMPFPCSIFGTEKLLVGNNGGIGFNSTPLLTGDNREIPSSSAFAGGTALLPFWDDLDDQTGDVWYLSIGLPPERIFVVEWRDRPHAIGDPVVDGNETTFEVQFFETPVNGVYAQFLYKDTDFKNPKYDYGASASVGFQLSESWGVQYSFEQAKITPSTVLSLRQDQPTSSDKNGNGIPDECEFPPGDLNCDGVVNAFDIDPFVKAITKPADYDAQYPQCDRMFADINGDGTADAFDIDPFVKLLTGG